MTSEQIEVINRYKNCYSIDLNKGLNVSIQKDRNVEEDEEYSGIKPNSLVLCIQPTDSNNFDQSIYDILSAFFEDDIEKYGISEFTETGFEFEGSKIQFDEWIKNNKNLNFIGYI